jgi:hypothetical protein
VAAVKAVLKVEMFKQLLEPSTQAVAAAAKAAVAQVPTAAQALLLLDTQFKGEKWHTLHR